MACLAETTTGDFDLSSGNLQVVTDVAQETAWKLTGLFLFFLGEWFADARLGIPMVQYVFVKNPHLGLIGQMFNTVLTTPPAVTQVVDMELDFLSSQRELDTTFQVAVNTGQVLTGGIGKPFIVSQGGA